MGSNFDFDAARRAFGSGDADVTFTFFGQTFHVATEPLLGDVFDLKDSPDHLAGLNDIDTIRTLTRFVHTMLVLEDRPRWIDTVRMLPASQAFALVDLVAWITEQVTGNPTLPPADSSVGRPATGETSNPSTAGTAA
jgi:hypothetical protein